ncbi:hypothetical protein DM01DRAFT_1312780 [Hesseltinella vesiculosa]|uniref:RGS domain-containing protein n=1 Tax=Hesseltinella vesiculosa TaxID=101127 RepID=A0A1X2G3H4_9FUNG|nr:hypothetical protein DM01DRAFT_1312780 [Hesseltinella vesiculosa]
MQIDRTSSASTTNRRRPSFINLSGTQAVQQDDILSPRTPKSIAKSRRGSISLDQNKTHDVLEASKVPTRSDSLKRMQKEAKGKSAVPSAQVITSPPLLSDRSPGYFDLEASQPSMTPAALAVAAHLRSQQQQPPSPYYTQAFRQMSVNDPPASSSTTVKPVKPTTPPARPRSSSISSISNKTPPNFDVHMLYRVKTQRTAKKVDNFFGDNVPIDKSIKEIRKEGLKAMLKSHVPLCYFLFHLLEEYSHENLFFHIELEQYEAFRYVSLVQQLATAQHIYNTYLTRNSHFEVNLDDRVRRQVKEALDQKQVDTCFDAAKRSVYSLLESSYMRFLTTKIYHRMLKDCGESASYYKEETRYAAVNVLLAYIEREHNMIYKNPLTDTPVFQSVSQTTRRRHELIKSMIHEFCRTLVGVEFSYYRMDPETMEQQLIDHDPPHSPVQESKSPKLLPRPKFDFLKRK